MAHATIPIAPSIETAKKLFTLLQEIKKKNPQTDEEFNKLMEGQSPPIKDIVYLGDYTNPEGITTKRPKIYGIDRIMSQFNNKDENERKVIQDLITDLSKMDAFRNDLSALSEDDFNRYKDLKDTIKKYDGADEGESKPVEFQKYEIPNYTCFGFSHNKNDTTKKQDKGILVPKMDIILNHMDKISINTPEDGVKQLREMTVKLEQLKTVLSSIDSNGNNVVQSGSPKELPDIDGKKLENTPADRAKVDWLNKPEDKKQIQELFDKITSEHTKLKSMLSGYVNMPTDISVKAAIVNPSNCSIADLKALSCDINAPKKDTSSFVAISTDKDLTPGQQAVKSALSLRSVYRSGGVDGLNEDNIPEQLKDEYLKDVLFDPEKLLKLSEVLKENILTCEDFYNKTEGIFFPNDFPDDEIRKLGNRNPSYVPSDLLGRMRKFLSLSSSIAKELSITADSGAGKSLTLEVLDKDANVVYTVNQNSKIEDLNKLNNLISDGNGKNIIVCFDEYDLIDETAHVDKKFEDALNRLKEKIEKTSTVKFINISATPLQKKMAEGFVKCCQQYQEQIEKNKKSNDKIIGNNFGPAAHAEMISASSCMTSIDKKLKDIKPPITEADLGDIAQDKIDITRFVEKYREKRNILYKVKKELEESRTDNTDDKKKKDTGLYYLTEMLSMLDAHLRSANRFVNIGKTKDKDKNIVVDIRGKQKTIPLEKDYPFYGNWNYINRATVLTSKKGKDDGACSEGIISSKVTPKGRLNYILKDVLIDNAEEYKQVQAENKENDKKGKTILISNESFDLIRKVSAAGNPDFLSNISTMNHQKVALYCQELDANNNMITVAYAITKQHKGAPLIRKIISDPKDPGNFKFLQDWFTIVASGTQRRLMIDVKNIGGTIHKAFDTSGDIAVQGENRSRITKDTIHEFSCDWAKKRALRTMEWREQMENPKLVEFRLKAEEVVYNHREETTVENVKQQTTTLSSTYKAKDLNNREKNIIKIKELTETVRAVVNSALSAPEETLEDSTSKIAQLLEANEQVTKLQKTSNSKRLSLDDVNIFISGSQENLQVAIDKMKITLKQKGADASFMAEIEQKQESNEIQRTNIIKNPESNIEVTEYESWTNFDLDGPLDKNGNRIVSKANDVQVPTEQPPVRLISTNNDQQENDQQENDQSGYQQENYQQNGNKENDQSNEDPNNKVFPRKSTVQPDNITDYDTNENDYGNKQKRATLYNIPNISYDQRDQNNPYDKRNNYGNPNQNQTSHNRSDQQKSTPNQTKQAEQQAQQKAAQQAKVQQAKVEEFQNEAIGNYIGYIESCMSNENNKLTVLEKIKNFFGITNGDIEAKKNIADTLQSISTIYERIKGQPEYRPSDLNAIKEAATNLTAIAKQFDIEPGNSTLYKNANTANTSCIEHQNKMKRLSNLAAEQQQAWQKEQTARRGASVTGGSGAGSPGGGGH